MSRLDERTIRRLEAIRDTVLFHQVQIEDLQAQAADVADESLGLSPGRDLNREADAVLHEWAKHAITSDELVSALATIPADR